MAGINSTRSARVAARLAAITVAAACAAATLAGQPARASAAAGDIMTRYGALALAVHRNVVVLPRLRRDDSPLTTEQCQAQFQVDCYNPEQVQQAYHVGGLLAQHVDGRGRTIVIVDEYGSPTIGSDLAAFDSQTGLPPASLRVSTPLGRMPGFDSSDDNQVGWASETTLDVEWAHVLAPGARIVLLEVTPVHVLDGLKYAINHRVGDVISLSWSAAEILSGDTPSDDIQFLRYEDRLMFEPAARKHITVVDATGDDGASYQNPDGSYVTHPVADWPATDPNVTAVGGSTLHLDDQGNRTSADTVWNDTYNQAANNLLNGDDGPSPIATGGGKSAVFGWPYYQATVGHFTGWRRGIPDISMSGACTGAVDIYSTFPGQPPGWDEVCGTSESAPLFAGVAALADQEAGRPLGVLNAALYRIAAAHLPGIVTITSGNNTVSFAQDGGLVTVRGYSARHGYSMAAGLGTIDARYLISELAHPSAPSHPKPKPKPKGH